MQEVAVASGATVSEGSSLIAGGSQSPWPRWLLEQTTRAEAGCSWPARAARHPSLRLGGPGDPGGHWWPSEVADLQESVSVRWS